MFQACSATCLQRHLQRAHAGAGDVRTRALAFQTAVNRLGTDARAAYDGHRGRLMRLVGAVQRGSGVCVLGAGNGNDLDLPFLLRTFGDVHLVDVDGEALARAVADLSAAQRAQITLHAGLDLSGCLDRIDDWGDRLPDDGALTAFAAEAAARIGRAIGRTFDVVLSACLLSQLCHPLQNALALPLPDWQRLFATVTRLHLATCAALTDPGGSTVIACDVLCQAGAALEAFRARTRDETLGEALVRAVESRTIVPDPDPRALQRLLASAAFSDVVDRVHVTEPWLWDLGATAQVVYGVVFRRA
jgi:hypothetical protein